MLVLFVSIPHHENIKLLNFFLHIKPNCGDLSLPFPTDFEHGLHDGIYVKVNTYYDARQVVVGV